jgi:hypothetical protein
MADQKLSELSYVTTAGAGDLLYVVQGGYSKKIAVSSLALSAHAAIINNNTPLHSTSTGTQGQIYWDSSYLYVCVSSNTWIRSAINTSW